MFKKVKNSVKYGFQPKSKTISMSARLDYMPGQYQEASAWLEVAATGIIQ
jgi:hypothetical protein